MSDRRNAPAVTEAIVQRALAFTDEVVGRYPARVAGSEADRRAGERVRQEFEGCCDPGSVRSEEFVIHPWSFLKYIPGLVVLYLACMVLLYFGLAWISFAGLAVGLFVFIGQFLFYWPLLDPLFPSARAYNVSGVIEPEGTVRQQVIISAHHDAAYVFQILARLPKLYFPLMMIGVGLLLISLLVALAASIMSLFGPGFPQWVAVIFMVLGIFELPFLFFTTNQVVPGAGDNMIAVAVASEIGKLFIAEKEAGNPLKHTRLIVASFDAEECGIRGARAYVRAHREEMLKTSTYVLNMDTLYHLKSLNFFDADLNSTVKLSRQMADECVGIAKSLGYVASVSRMSPGGGSTDAAAFGEAGVEATNLAAMSFNVADYTEGFAYHTQNDLSSCIEPAVVKATLEIIREYVLRKDAEASAALVEKLPIC